MRVLAVHGSPRVGGNTESLVAEVLRGAEVSGADTTCHRLNDITISPCQGCDACKTTKRCRVDDDMQELYDAVLEADALVIGTPIYFWGPSAQTKVFLDRLYALDTEGVRERLSRKHVLLVCAFADDDLRTADNAVNMLRSGSAWFDMVFHQPLLAVASARGEVKGQADTMDRAYRAGLHLAKAVASEMRGA